MIRALKLKLAILVLGTGVFYLGMDSHFRSSWNRKVPCPPDSSLTTCPDVKVYEMCHTKDRIPKDATCPDISMEQYFIVVVLTCQMLSLLVIMFSVRTALWNELDYKIDLGYHAISSFMVVIAGMVYITSAYHIQKLHEKMDDAKMDDDGMELLLTNEKYIAGGVTILYGLHFALTAGVMFRDHQNRADPVSFSQLTESGNDGLCTKFDCE